MVSSYVTLGEYETTLTIPPGQQNYVVATFPPNTVISTTYYIANTTDIPTGSTDEFVVGWTDWTNAQHSSVNLDSYKYGKYMENYPLQQITVSNNFPVTIQFYLQYIIKSYYEYYSPDVQDLTQLQLNTVIVTEGLTGGTNFRFMNGISSISFTGFPASSLFYILDQQIIGTSISAAGTGKIPWTAQYSEQLSVAAVGYNEDINVYSFNVDSTTSALPGSVSNTNSTWNWIVMDFFSPLAITPVTVSGTAIYYNSTSGEFEADIVTSETNCAYYFNAVGAPFTNLTVSVT